MFTLNPMLTTLSSGDFLKSQKLHPTIELAHQNWVLGLKTFYLALQILHTYQDHT